MKRKPNAAPKRRRRSRFFTVNGPRKLIDNTNGRELRIVFHEDRKARQALDTAMKLCNERIDRLNAICAGDGSIGVRFYAYPEDWALEPLAKPWKPGGKRAKLVLYGDRPSVSGMLQGGLDQANREVQGELGSKDVRAVAANLRKTAKQLVGFARVLESEVAKHPDRWAPLPTLGEIMGEPKGGVS